MIETITNTKPIPSYLCCTYRRWL